MNTLRLLHLLGINRPRNCSIIEEIAFLVSFSTNPFSLNLHIIILNRFANYLLWLSCWVLLNLKLDTSRAVLKGKTLNLLLPDHFNSLGGPKMRRPPSPKQSHSLQHVKMEKGYNQPFPHRCLPECLPQRCPLEFLLSGLNWASSRHLTLWKAWGNCTVCPMVEADNTCRFWCKMGLTVDFPCIFPNKVYHGYSV